jgi:prepilin-type N-terminal cleavage/methylation domain-containing protein
MKRQKGCTLIELMVCLAAFGMAAFGMAVFAMVALLM